MVKSISSLLIVSAVTAGLSAGTLLGGEPDQRAAAARQYRIHDPARPRPPIIEPAIVPGQDQPGKPPSDAIVLFDGADLSQWRAIDGSAAKWVVKDSVMESVKGSGYIRTLRAFGDCQLHVEWASPSHVEGKGQGRGNSGVFLMGVYEIQVLDSFQNDTYPDGQAAAVYGQYPPEVNASRGPGQWQTYDILFQRPHFDQSGKLLSPARVTVLHNGVLVQNNVEILGPTTWMNRPPYQPHADKLPLSLQDHGNPVRFRNIWIRELPARPLAERDRDMRIVPGRAALDELVGQYRNEGGGPAAIISREGDQLMASFAGGPVRPIHARSENEFVSAHIGIEFEFQREGGSVTGVVIKHGEDRIPLKRAR
jgi:hypothetical protein